MGNLRPILIMGLLLLAYMMWVEWQKDYGPAPQTPAIQQPVDGGDVPSPTAVPQTGAAPNAAPEDLPIPAAPTGDAQTVNPAQAPESEQQLITVRTDVLEIRIDPVGGTLVEASLLNYPVEQKKPDITVRLLQPAGERHVHRAVGTAVAGSRTQSHHPVPVRSQ